jgi:hypothetical protein
MKKLIVLLLLCFGSVTAQVKVVQINSTWNKQNDLKLNLKNCQYEYALLENLTPNLKSQVKSVPFIYVLKNGHIVGQFDGGLRMKLNVTEEELQQFIDRINDGQ